MVSCPLNNSIPRATAVSAVRETSPFANFGTADTAVARIFNRLLAADRGSIPMLNKLSLVVICMALHGELLPFLIRRQDGATLVFADQKGKEFTVQEADIDERVQSAVSLMPTNLYELVKPEQIGHLLAYLLEQRAAVTKASE